MNGATLDRATISKLILAGDTGQPPLVEELLSLEEQLQPNGFDLSLQAVSQLRSAGSMAGTRRNGSCRKRSRWILGRTVGCI